MKRIVLLMLFSIISIIFSCSKNDTKVKYPIAEKGILDLAEWDFEKNGIIKLDGKWEFYWNQLLEPHHFQNAPRITGIVDVPGIWKNYEINGTN